MDSGFVMEGPHRLAHIIGHELVSIEQVSLGREGPVTAALAAGAPRGVWKGPANSSNPFHLPSSSCVGCCQVLEIGGLLSQSLNSSRTQQCFKTVIACTLGELRSRHPFLFL